MMAPALSMRVGPKRSAIAPVSGWAAPHSSIWIARARENTSRPHACELEIGVSRNASPKRAPKPITAMRQPHARVTIGLRQLATKRTSIRLDARRVDNASPFRKVVLDQSRNLIRSCRERLKAERNQARLYLRQCNGTGDIIVKQGNDLSLHT